MLTLEIGLAKFEVIPTNRSRVWTYLVHFTIDLVIFESKMTSQWQSELNFHFFLQKSIMSTLEICLAKFEMVPTNIYRVWTCLLHFATNFVIFHWKMISQWQSEPDFHLFLQKSIMLTLEIGLAKFEVIKMNRSRVWTCVVHFTINLVIFESKVTSQWQSEPDFQICFCKNH